MRFEHLEPRAMLAITLPVGGNQLGAPVNLASDATVEANTLTIVYDDTSNASFVTATITAASVSGGTTTQTYFNFSGITFTGTADLNGLITNDVRVFAPYQADVHGFGVGTSLSPTNWQVDASFSASPFIVSPDPAFLDLFLADSLDVYTGLIGGNGPSEIAGTFQSPTNLLIPGTTGAIIGLTDATFGITSDTASTPIQAYDLSLASTSGAIALDADVSVVSDLSISGNAGSLSLGGTTTTRSFVAALGDIAIANAVGPISVTDSTFAALNGGISITTPSTLTVSGTTSAFTASNAYVPALAPNGVVQLQGSLALTLPTAIPVTAGRLEISTTGVAAISLTNLAVGSLEAVTGGSLSVVNGVPLTISDFTNAVTVEIQGTDITLQSPSGIRVVDGIAATGTRVLSTYVSGSKVTPSVPVDFAVTATADNPSSGAPFAGTFRDMIRYANANATLPAALTAGVTVQPMRILFDEAGSPVAAGGVVTLASSLPTLAKPVTIDGSLPDGSIVGIDGAGAATTGILLGPSSSSSTIRDAALYGCKGAAIRVESADNLFSGLILGADRTGSPAVGNMIGVEFFGSRATRNVLGVKTIGADSGNQIYASTQAGVLIRNGANANAIYGNTIGGTGAGQPNAEGVHVVSSTGTLIGGARTELQNFIVGSTRNGVRLTTVNAVSVPYGAQIVNNTISDNSAAGVLIEGGGRNLVGGTGFKAANALLRNTVGVQLQSSGTVRTQGNQIVNNTISDSGTGGILIDQAFGNLVQANAVSDTVGNSSWGVRVFRAPQGRGFTPNKIYQNTVSGSGTSAITGGIVVENSSGQIIGGPGTLGNVVVSNGGSGIVVRGGTGVNASTGNVVEGNLVGTESTGANLGNAFDGIRIQGSVGNVVRANTVRNNSTQANNSAGIGVYDAVSSGTATGNSVVLNTVAGNYVGIRVSGGSNNAIGGRVSGLGNWVFSNVSDGILVDRSNTTGDATATVIAGNRVGLSTGPEPAGNGGYGINLVSTVGSRVEQVNIVAYNAGGGIHVEGGRNAVIGSVAANLGNVVRDNGNDGISLVQPSAPGRTEAVLIVGNTVRGNAGNGVSVVDTSAVSAAAARVSGVTIGRAVSTNRPDASTNTIVANGLAGVLVDRAQAVSIIGNAITGNLGSKQIELVNDANAILAPTTATVAAPSLTVVAPRVAGQASPQIDVRGTVSRTGTGTAAQTVWIDIYGTNTATNRQIFLGRVAVTIPVNAATASFRVMVARSGLRFNQVVATSTLGSGTSEFSNTVGV